MPRRKHDAGSTLRLTGRGASSISAAARSAAGRASSVTLGLLLATGSLVSGSGCSWLTRSGSSTDIVQAVQSSVPAQPSAASVPGVDEELVGPPLPEHLQPDADGDEELVGPPLPPQGAESVGTPPQRATQPVTPSRTELLIAQLESRGISASQSTRGVVIVLPESVFGFGTAELPRESKRRLHGIADAIVAVANRSRVSVEGHTDSTGADLYNRGLSDRRAKAVGAELLTAGVGERRVRSVGYGADYPIAPNQRSDGSDDPSGRARNRRVEIVIETAMSSAP